MTEIISRGSRGPQPGFGATRQSLAKARAAWGEEIPDWIERLAEAADATSQAQVAKRLRFSGSVVNQVINNTYKGSLVALEQAVRGALFSEVLDCPVLGELRRNICLEHQKRARGSFNPTSSARVQLYRACKGGCVHSRIKQEFGHGE